MSGEKGQGGREQRRPMMKGKKRGQEKDKRHSNAWDSVSRAKSGGGGGLSARSKQYKRFFGRNLYILLFVLFAGISTSILLFATLHLCARCMICSGGRWASLFDLSFLSLQWPPVASAEGKLPPVFALSLFNRQ